MPRRWMKETDWRSALRTDETIRYAGETERPYYLVRQPRMISGCFELAEASAGSISVPTRSRVVFVGSAFRTGYRDTENAVTEIRRMPRCIGVTNMSSYYLRAFSAFVLRDAYLPGDPYPRAGTHEVNCPDPHARTEILRQARQG